MRSKQITITLLGTMCLLTLVFTVSARADTKGMIISRAGDTFVVAGPGGEKTTVVITDNTITKDNTGLFGLEREHLGDTVLIPGLKVDVDGSNDEQGRLVAKTITTDGDDLEASQMIQAGVTPTAEQVAANVQTLQTHSQTLAGHQQGIAKNQQDIATNQQNIASNQQQTQQNIQDIKENTDRFMALDDYDVKGQATVKFAVGSARISPADQKQLKDLAQNAGGLNGYTIEVIGYADATGNAEANTALSEKRAKAVVTFLVQQGNVPVRYIVAPGAMGEYGASATNETKAGRAENRRVEVKVLVNKGITGA